MLQNAAIDIAIALALMYLVLSLTCTVINEYVATKLQLRSKSLRVALQELLDDPQIRTAFYGHGLVSGTRTAAVKARLMSMMGSPPAPGAIQPGAEAWHPSYLSTDTFVLALVGSLTKQGGATSIPTFADVEAAVQRLPASKIKDALVTSLIVAQGNFDQFRANVATWFEDSMDRLSGAYKQHLKLISIVIGCAVAIVVNADTFDVGRALWSDGTLRAQMVQVASATVRTESAAAVASTNAPTLADIRKRLEASDQALRPFPIGWSGWSVDRVLALSWWDKLLKVLGLFATGLALSFGAPFWFDTLSKFMNLRAAGVKPERQT